MSEKSIREHYKAISERIKSFRKNPKLPENNMHKALFTFAEVGLPVAWSGDNWADELVEIDDAPLSGTLSEQLEKLVGRLDELYEETVNAGFGDEATTYFSGDLERFETAKELDSRN